MTDLERAALDFARAFLRAQSARGVMPLGDGMEAARSALSNAAREYARGLPDRASGDAFKERTLTIRPLLECGNQYGRSWSDEEVRQALECAWEAGRDFGRGEKR